MRCDDARPGQGLAQVGRAGGRSGMRAQCLQVGGERPVGAQERFDAEGRREVGALQQRSKVGDGEDELAEHAVGAVDEGEALLGPEFDGLDAVGGERVAQRAGRHRCGRHRPLADQAEGDVRQGGEVARAPERAVLGHDRGEPGVEQGDEALGHDGPGARAAHGERPGAQEHHGPYDLGLDRRPHAGRVTAHQGAL